MENFKESYEFYRQRMKESPEPAPVISAVTSFGRYGEFIKQRRGVHNAVDPNSVEEYVRYLNAPLAEEGTDVLSFWKTNQSSYPILSAMAKDYLTVQASSVSAERALLIW
jgi:hypothetical protein